MCCSTLSLLQEGVGPCVTCGALVCTPEEQALLSRDSKKASKLRESLMKQYNIQVENVCGGEGGVWVCGCSICMCLV